MRSNKKGNTGQDNRTGVLDAVRGDPIMLDRLADLPDGYLRCVSANSYEEAVRIFWSVWIATGQFRGNSDALRVYVFRNFYYFEESENE